MNIGRLRIQVVDRQLYLDWRQRQRGNRWRMIVKRGAVWYPFGMKPRRGGCALGVCVGWYPKGYEP